MYIIQNVYKMKTTSVIMEEIYRYIALSLSLSDDDEGYKHLGIIITSIVSENLYIQQ